MKQGTVNYFLKKYAQIVIKSDSFFPINLHAHTLRHSIAMTMYNNGIPISYIRDFLGHKSVEITSIYAHANEETIYKTLESLEELRIPEQTMKWKDKEDYLIEFCGLV
ncbi:tyrosine-type recombinase/integrase [Fundicoccus culcitae]|uniref:Tyrosine-type recombinase/integrase n=1 Tax=Fundicoccus culcitae TaxID=2969821 RepID=A0ABY5P913_9LACT|nr:tyrosine-type recombinase/integrase [Fundicoccus culcitae]UUX35232.1 tyrosine-type recombinase/integrase [Fundicoccus culcitae]